MRGVAALLAAAAFLAAAMPAPEASARSGNPDEDFDGRAPATIYATAAPYQFIHDIGRMTLQITNLGIIGNPYNTELSLGWKGNEYLGQAGLWVGALGQDGSPHVSSSIAGTKRLEFRPGRLPVDTIYPSYEGKPGGNRPGLFLADDDGDGRIDEDCLNGKDDDGDGLVDEDYSAIGQQMFSCEYRDDSPDAQTLVPDHVPLGIRVRQRSIQYSEEGFNQFVGLDFTIENVGDQHLKNVYVGFYVDADIGPRNMPAYYDDDLVGYTHLGQEELNPLLTGYMRDPQGLPWDCPYSRPSLDVAYMWDAPGGTDGSDARGYVGCVLLGCQSDVPDVLSPGIKLSTVRWTSSMAPYPEGDPRTDAERYALLSGDAFPRYNAEVPGDYRFVMAAGPWGTLNPGDKVSFDVALVVGDGFAGMARAALAAQMVYDGIDVDADHDPTTGADGKETCLKARPGGVVKWKDPCDSLATTVTFTDTSCTWVDNDCSPCTGLGGREGHIHWAGVTQPPEPVTNLGPGIGTAALDDPESAVYYESPGGDGQVRLQWDNRSELRPDPYTGRNIFEGYRIWRVADWTRPPGAVGPAPEEWKLMAEFRKSPLDGLGTASPYHLRMVERRDRTAIREMTPSGPLYHVGRYEWTDTSGVVNGKAYFYAVTALALDRRYNPMNDRFEDVLVGGLPSAVQKELVVPAWGAGSGCSSVKVVPNPYHGGAAWDLSPSDCDASGTRIAFRNLPADWERLEIYTLAGDLVFTGRPGESRVIGGCEVSPGLRTGGTFFWDLISRSGQDVASGVYIYIVETGRETCRGRFVIIR